MIRGLTGAMFAIKGEYMNTIKCDVDIAKGDELLAWVQEHLTTPSTIAVLKSDTVVQNGVSLMYTTKAGALSSFIRNRGGNFQSISSFTSSYDAVIARGSEFYLFSYST